MVGMALLTAMYLLSGGYIATALTDFIQGIIMIVGVLLMVFFVVGNDAVGGIGEGLSKIAEIDASLASPFGSVQNVVLLVSLVLLTSLVITSYSIHYTKLYDLYRLSRSKHSGEFILKGAMLLNIWMDRSHRPTRDIGFAGQGDTSPEQLVSIFQEICQVKVGPDGLEFDLESIQVTEIRETHEYQGQRIIV